MSAKKWIRRSWLTLLILGAMSYLLMPWPTHIYYSIRDQIRGHPTALHGSHPQKFVGLWIRDKTVIHDNAGEAFYLMPNGRVLGNVGMTIRQWHFDSDVFYIDSHSGCGNGFIGTQTIERSVEFRGPDELLISDKSGVATKGVVGRYRRVEVTEALKSKLASLQLADDEEASFAARCTLHVIEQYEFMKRNRSLL